MSKKQFKTAIASTMPQKKGIHNLISSTAEPQVPKQTSKVSLDDDTTEIEQVYTRQTFIIKDELLEKIKDLTHIRKQKDYYITQKDVLGEILEQYFNNYGEIKPRPDKVKILEKERGKKIREGKRG